MRIPFQPPEVSIRRPSRSIRITETAIRRKLRAPVRPHGQNPGNMISVRTMPGGVDGAGVLVSGACALHCALMPLLAGALPVVGFEFLAGERAEAILIGASCLLAIVSLTGGCRHHGQWRPFAVVAAGFTSIAIGRTLLDEPAWAERVAVVAGALCIASAHLVNWRLCCAMRK